MNKVFKSLFMLSAIVLISCSGGSSKEEKQDPHEEIEAASDSIPTDGADLGEYANENREDSGDSTTQDSTFVSPSEKAGEDN